MTKIRNEKLTIDIVYRPNHHRHSSDNYSFDLLDLRIAEIVEGLSDLFGRRRVPIQFWITRWINPDFYV